MASCIDAFPSADEAMSGLSEFARTFDFPRIRLGAEDIARESVYDAMTKSIARKCRGGAEIYGRWSSDAVPRMAKSARYVINQDQFDILVRRTALDLLRFWCADISDCHARLSLGAAFRAVDLLFMSLNESETCRSGLVQNFLHVPLEGATLRPLRLCIDELIDRDYAIEIPTTVPSGFVATEEQYTLLQEAIFALAEGAGVPPITYAYFCASLSSS